MKVVYLNKGERLLFKISSTPISSVSILQRTSANKGDLTPTLNKLRTRFCKVIQANPWLCGYITNCKVENKPCLMYPERLSDEMVEKLVDKYFFHVKVSDLSWAENIGGKDYEKTTSGDLFTLSEGVAPYVLRCTLARDHLDETRNHEIPLVRLSVISKKKNTESTKPVNERIAVAFSLSHYISDGTTYFQLLNMISGQDEITTMNCVRVEGFNGSTPFMHSLIFICLTMQSIIIQFLLHFLGREIQMVPTITHVQKSYIDERKKELNVGDNWVSTNDIIVSDAARQYRAGTTMMSVSLRDRVPDVTKNMAGAYVRLMLMKECTAKSPQNVRRILMDGPTSASWDISIFSILSTIFSRVMLCTSWSTDSKELLVYGFEEIFHGPCLHHFSLTFFEPLIIFRSYKKNLTFMFLEKNIAMKNTHK